jgi:pyrimidine-nucleoside phosphorylase
MLGGGRETKESIIDLGVGIILAKKVGDYVEQGEAVATIYANDESNLEAAKIRLLDAYDFSVEKQDKNVLIKKVIR